MPGPGARLEQVAQLRRDGQTVQASAVLQTVPAGPLETQDLVVQCASELLLSGDWQTAQRLVAQVSDLQQRQTLDIRHFDAAILHGEAGIASLPAALQTPARDVWQALVCLESGDDPAAHKYLEALAPDALLYDWKLFIQGFIDFYAQSPTALASWEQLQPQRLPAVIVAPFRAQLDPDFLARHSRTQQRTLSATQQTLSPDAWLHALEEVQRLLTHGTLAAALRSAGRVAQAMMPFFQDFRERLARIFYWEVARYGTLNNVRAYQKTFGAPADDPALHRLQALAWEQQDDPAAAQIWWAKYEQDLAQPSVCEASDANLARSLVWLHLGKLAEQVAPPLPAPGLFALAAEDEDLCPFPASACYQRSAALAPQHLAAHEHLLDCLQTLQRQPEMIVAAQQLLAAFPDNERALTILAEEAANQHQWQEAVTYQERAVRGRPHDATLSQRLERYQLGLAREHAQQGRFPEARAILTAALEKTPAAERGLLLNRLASVELKAGETERGIALFTQACQVEKSRLGVVFQMLTESIRLSLDPDWTAQMDREFQQGLRAKVQAAHVVALLAWLAALVANQVHYEGLEQHRQQILQYLGRAKRVAFSEENMIHICGYLSILSEQKLLVDFANRSSRKWPRQPAFPYVLARYYMSLGPDQCPLPQLQTALNRALRLARADATYAEMARELESLQETMQTLMFLQQFQDHMGDSPGALPQELDDVLMSLFEAFVDEDEGLFDFDDDEPPASPRPAPRQGSRQSRSRRRKP